MLKCRRSFYKPRVGQSLFHSKTINKIFVDKISYFYLIKKCAFVAVWIRFSMLICHEYGNFDHVNDESNNSFKAEKKIILIEMRQKNIQCDAFEII